MPVKIIIIIVGLAALCFLGYRAIDKISDEKIIAKQKNDWMQATISKEVYCDECYEVSPHVTPYKRGANFQVCPECGVTAARPIVYFVCNNPPCNETLFKVANTVYQDGKAYPSPDRIECPTCNSGEFLDPMGPIHIKAVEEIAEKTGQKLD